MISIVGMAITAGLGFLIGWLYAMVERADLRWRLRILRAQRDRLRENLIKVRTLLEAKAAAAAKEKSSVVSHQ